MEHLVYIVSLKEDICMRTEVLDNTCTNLIKKWHYLTTYYRSAWGDGKTQIDSIQLNVDKKSEYVALYWSRRRTVHSRQIISIHITHKYYPLLSTCNQYKHGMQIKHAIYSCYCTAINNLKNITKYIKFLY